jgi:hypothetical protein
MTTAGQLEAYFESDHRNPAPSSLVAEKMRELLEKNPGLSFDELRELARSQMKRVEGGAKTIGTSTQVCAVKSGN